MFYILVLVIVIFVFICFIHKCYLTLFGGHSIHLFNSLNKELTKDNYNDKDEHLTVDEKPKCEVIDFIFMAVFVFYKYYSKDNTKNRKWLIFDRQTNKIVQNPNKSADAYFQTALDSLKIDPDMDKYVRSHISKYGLKDLFYKTMLAIRFNNYRMSNGFVDTDGEVYFEQIGILFMEFTTIMMVNYKLYPEIIKYVVGGGNNTVIFLRLHNYEKNDDTYPRDTHAFRRNKRGTVQAFLEYKEHFYGSDIEDEGVIIKGVEYRADVEKTISECMIEKEDHKVVKEELTTKAPIFVLRFAPLAYNRYIKRGENEFTTNKIDSKDGNKPLAVLRFNQGTGVDLETGVEEKETNEYNKTAFHNARKEDEARKLWIENELQEYSLPMIINRRLRSYPAKNNNEETIFSNSFTLSPLGNKIDIEDELKRNAFIKWLTDFSTHMHSKGLLYVDYKYDQFKFYNGNHYVVDIGCSEIKSINKPGDYFKINSTIHPNHEDVSNEKDKSRNQLLAYGMDILYMLASITLINEEGTLIVADGIKINDLINEIIDKIKNDFSGVYEDIIRQFSIACILLQLSETTNYFNDLRFNINSLNYDNSNTLSIGINLVKFNIHGHDIKINDTINIVVKTSENPIHLNNCCFVHPS